MDHTSDELVSKFNRATEYVRGVAGELKPDQLLVFYGYFKQATVGPCNTDKPSWYQFEAKQKWDAWKALGSMTKEDAMKEYVQVLNEVHECWEDESPKNLAWVSVSCMAREEDGLLDSDKDIFDRVKEGDVSKLRELVKSEGVNVKDEEGLGLLHWAADRGHEDVVALLINMKADVNLRDSTGQTPLHYASACGHKKVVHLLIDSGALADVACEDGDTPLDIACDEATKSIIQSALRT